MPNNTEKLDLTPKDFSFICPLNMDELTPVEADTIVITVRKKFMMFHI